MYVDDPFESKYQLLVKGREQVRIKNLKSLETFFDYSQIVDDTYGNLEDFNPIMKRKLLILFDNMEADMEVTITFSPIVTRLFLRWRKLNFSLVFTPKSYFNVPKTIKIDAKHCCIIKVTNQKTYLKK